ncbi:hypothetical protein BH10PSE12_BH10PSE12_04860 [soil metagenome]
MEDAEDRGPERISPRDSLFLLTAFTTPAGVPLGKARVRNLSATGLMADCDVCPAKGQAVIVELRGVGRISGAIAWNREGRMGIVFDRPIDPQLARKPIGAGKQPMPHYLRTPDFARRH